MIPASGWLPPGMTLGSPVLSLPLPVPHTGTYRDGGEIVGRQVAQALVSHRAGGALASAVAGRNADNERALAVTLSQTETFGVVLVDSVDFDYVLPSPAFDRSYHVWIRVEVRDPDRVFHSLSALAGTDWVEEVEWDEDVDQPVAQATVTLFREGYPATIDGTTYDTSLAPMLVSSRLNRLEQDPAASFAPLLEPGREIRISTATTYAGEEPVAEDWRGGFWGIIDEVDWGPGNRVKLSARDLGSRLLDAFIEEEKDYATVPEGQTPGTPPGVVIQQMLDDSLRQLDAQGNHLPNSVVLAYDKKVNEQGQLEDVLPEWNVNPFRAERKPLMEKLREIALQFGWDVRYRWDANRTESRLTLYSPDREKDDPDWVVGPSDYLDVTRLSVSHADVRNVVRVLWVENNEQHSLTEQNGDSILRYGRRFMELQEASTSLIDTESEARDLARYALNDLAEPVASQEVEMLYFWPVRVADLFLFHPNGVHYDVAQQLAVVRVKHTLGREKQRTSVAVRGKPAGAYRDWLRRERRGSVVPPPKPVIVVAVKETQAEATIYDVSATSPDGSKVSLWYAFGGDDFDEAPNLSNPGEVPAPRTTNADEKMLRIRARSEKGAEEQQIISADFDVQPEIVFVNPPEPMYAGTVQSGWRITGAVDDDTRTLVVTLDGDPDDMEVSLVMTEVAEGAVARIDTRVFKTFRVDVLQNPGASGLLTLTPCEKYLPTETLTGVVGQPFQMMLQRPPETTATPRENSLTLRDVVFTVNPEGAELRYRVLPYPKPSNADELYPWTVEPVPEGEPVVSRAIDVKNGPQLVEFYATTAAVVTPGSQTSTASRGATEAVKQLLLDAGDAPQIVDLKVNEDPEKFINLSLSIDDDVLSWKAWARRISRPVDARSGEPDDIYLRFSGTRNTLSAGWHAEPGLWRVLVRGYDYRGQYAQEEAEIQVLGMLPTEGVLQNLRVARQTEPDGFVYNDVIWDHNSVIEQEPQRFTVSIYENGQLKVANRDVRLDHDESTPGSGGANLGGWHRRVLPAVQGHPDARYLTFNYEVHLFEDGHPAGTYSVPYSDWYLGTGDPVDPPGTQVMPTDLDIAGGRERATASWTNASDDLEVLIEWQVLRFSDWVDQEEADGSEDELIPWRVARVSRVNAGVTTVTEPFPGNYLVRFRAAHRNIAGVGEFTEPSSSAFSIPATTTSGYGWKIAPETEPM